MRSVQILKCPVKYSILKTLHLKVIQVLNDYIWYIHGHLLSLPWETELQVCFGDWQWCVLYITLQNEKKTAVTEEGDHYAHQYFHKSQPSSTVDLGFIRQTQLHPTEMQSFTVFLLWTIQSLHTLYIPVKIILHIITPTVLLTPIMKKQPL